MYAAVLPPGKELVELIAAAVFDDGPAVLPLSPALPAPALRAALAELRPTHLVDGEGRRRLSDGVGSDAALIIATSGSTGAPKGVELPAAAVRASAAASLARLGARPGDRWLCCLPLTHIAGVQVVVRALLGGSEPILHERFDPAAVLACPAEYVSLVPTQLRRLLEHGADLRGRPAILLGGAAAPAGLLERARAAGARIVTSYGMSETCGGCVYDGTPLDGVAVRIGADSRIRISGPVLMSGYRLRPELTRQALEDGWFVTADLGELADGRLRVLGRADDVIVTGGEKVVAGAVAALLAEHPAVAEAAVVGRADPEWGQRVTAVVVPADPLAPPSLAELRAFVKERMPAYAAPRELEVREALPLLPNGKPDLARLREPGAAAGGA